MVSYYNQVKTKYIAIVATFYKKNAPKCVNKVIPMKDKNIYRESREAVGLTREVAAERLVFISEDRLERIENEKSAPHPDEIRAMAEQYRNPKLCNYYCSNECPIGKGSVPEIDVKDFSQIALEMLSTINALSRQKDLLIDIAADGNITREEIEGFATIRENLDKMSLSIESLKLWLEQEHIGS